MGGGVTQSVPTIRATMLHGGRNTESLRGRNARACTFFSRPEARACLRRLKRRTVPVAEAGSVWVHIRPDEALLPSVADTCAQKVGVRGVGRRMGVVGQRMG